MKSLLRIVGIGAVLTALCWIVFALIPTPTLEAPASTEGVLDMHVHAAGIGAGGSGAFVNQEMGESWRFPFYLRAFGVTREELEVHGDGLVIARISAQVAASTRVSKAVVLALDGVVDAAGQLDRNATQVYVPNAFVAREAARYDNLCFGPASIPTGTMPWRVCARHTLTARYWSNGFRTSWPSTRRTNRSARSCELVALRLPLLSHAGQERSFASARDELGDPRRLALPLSMGVTVIAAHVATTGENEGEGNFERIAPMFERFPSLYADVSSLTQINKLGYLQRSLAIHGLEQRLLYGTDWPLQFFPAGIALLPPAAHRHRHRQSAGGNRQRVGSRCRPEAGARRAGARIRTQRRVVGDRAVRRRHLSKQHEGRASRQGLVVANPRYVGRLSRRRQWPAPPTSPRWP